MNCVTPYTPSVAGQVVRIYARFPSWMDGQEKVFIFEGELVDIWESGNKKKPRKIINIY